MNLVIIILAAGKSKRMCSSFPKVLQPLAGVSLLERVVETAQKLDTNKIYVVYGEQGDYVKEKLGHLPVEWVHQPELLGTGHAVMQTLDKLNDNQAALVLYGDMPLILNDTLYELFYQTPQDAIGWLTSNVQDPTGFGRIIRDSRGIPHAIVEERDATSEQKKICEINTGICLIPVKYLKNWLPMLRRNNSQGEYYLTDILSVAKHNGVKVVTVSTKLESESLGVNDQAQLAHVERVFQKQRALEYMKKGLKLFDPDRFDVRGEFTFSHDVVIDVNVILEGEVSIGSNCYIGPNVLLKNVIIGNDVEIKANSVIEDSIIGKGCVVGPFTRIRPKTVLKPYVTVGNFIEVKKSEIGEYSKAAHFGYIGDSTVGKYVNIGAGAITCNYDGISKYQTRIDDNAFIGSNSILIAPVRIGEDAYIGAGSVITSDAPCSKLTISRCKGQTTIDHWIRPDQRDEMEDEERGESE